MRVLAILLILASQALAQANKARSDSARQYYEDVRAIGGLSGVVTRVCFFDGSPDSFDVFGFSREFKETANTKGVRLEPAETKVSDRDVLLLQIYDKGIKTGESVLQHDTADQNGWYENLSSKAVAYRLHVTISASGQYRRIVTVNDKLVPGEDRYGRCEPIR